MTTLTTVRGGWWLIEDTPLESVFTPERLSDEHRLIGQTADEFMTNEVLPAIEQLEQKDWQLARRLVARAGELGLLGTDVPDEFGGVGLDKVASILVGEAMGRSASFATTFGAQTGLAITPILCFGTEAQKEKYLAKLVNGELVGAYALSESGSGSDALGAKARAIRQPDGSFAISGEKMWITNGGFADLFIVFAKVVGDGPDAFTAFLVERGFPGVSNGKEEHKMGLHGSSTTPLILQDARVPAENVLGEIGKGHKVAFNVLNYGRFKLAAMCSGGARAIVGEAAKYASQRKQFGQPIAQFGAIKHKLAEIAIREFAVESMLYRTAALIDQAIESKTSASSGEAVLAALEEFAIEASILKVAGSEMIDYAVDENVQIHGGNGFVRDYPAERAYRDARVNRIFEGTNEINRLLIPGMLIRRALKGGLPLIPAAKKLQDEILTPSPAEPPSDEPLENARRTVASLKKVALVVLGTAMQTYGEKLTEQQELLTLASDIIIDVFATESVVLRAAQIPPNHSSIGVAAAEVYVADAAGRVEIAARTALAAMAEGDNLRTLLAALRRVLKPAPVNTVARRRQIADAIIDRKAYPYA
ncbi:MAG TPA: acyl-CoA dehydrogenase family protein [Vicinamibacterales bacterium]|nr:acyl-CoA dehydrogenase family protein [Vicinamibacterales bacterium]